MPPTNPTTGQYVDFPVFNAMVPSEGPKVVSAQFDFTIADAYSVDLSNLVQRKFISLVQTLFIYNPGTVPVTVTFDVAGQNIVFPPQSEGYVPVLVTNPPKCTIASAGGASNVGVFFLNVPTPAAIWPIVTYIPPTTAGLLQVQDQILETIVSGGYANVLNSRTVNDDGVKPVYQADTWKTGQITAAGPTALHTAAAGMQFFISDIDINMSGDADFAGSPGNLTITLLEGATAIRQWVTSLPAASKQEMVRISSMSNLGYIAAGAATALNLQLSAALTAGVLSYNIGVGDTIQTQ